MQTISLLATLLVVAAFGAASVNADKKSVQEKRQDKMATRLSICERKSKVVNNKIATLKENIKTALGDADAAMAVDCVETGNAVTDCTADCAVAVATVTTAPFGIGAACKGDHACVAGADGALGVKTTGNWGVLFLTFTYSRFLFCAWLINGLSLQHTLFAVHVN